MGQSASTATNKEIVNKIKETEFKERLNHSTARHSGNSHAIKFPGSQNSFRNELRRPPYLGNSGLKLHYTKDHKIAIGLVLKKKHLHLIKEKANQFAHVFNRLPSETPDSNVLNLV